MLNEATTMSCMLLFDCLLAVSPSETSCFLLGELVYTLASSTWRYMLRQRTTRSTENVSDIHFISFHFISFHFISFHFISFHFISFHSIPFHFIPFHSIPFHFMSINFCMPLFIILECTLHIPEPGFTVMRLYVHLQLKFQFFLVISPNLMAAKCLQTTV